MTPLPPPEAAPKQLARAVLSSSSLRILNLSGTALPVRCCVGESSELSLAHKRLHDRDAALLASLLCRNSQLAELDLSHCRMSEAATLSI
eukprot:1861942-Pleurochrysis_carterae.AAC.1